jgi:hypothetical protein
MCVQKVIQAFGGIRALARALGHANPSTVSGWYRRGRVPWRQIPIVIEAAEMRGIAIEYSDFFVRAESGEEADCAGKRTSFCATPRSARIARID